MWACFHPAGSVPDTSTMTLLNLTKCTALTSQLGNWGTLKMHLNTCRENVMKTEPGFFQQCPATEQKAMGTNWKKGDSHWTSGNAALLWGSMSTSTGCSGQLRNLHPWRYWWTHCHGQRPLGLLSWLSRKFEPHDLQRSFQTKLFIFPWNHWVLFSYFLYLWINFIKI